MADQNSGTLLALAKVGAVVVALGALAWFVANAQSQANEDADNGKATHSDGGGASGAGGDAGKGAEGGTPADAPEGTEEKPKPKSRNFMPSSKSIVIEDLEPPKLPIQENDTNDDK